MSCCSECTDNNLSSITSVSSSSQTHWCLYTRISTNVTVEDAERLEEGGRMREREREAGKGLHLSSTVTPAPILSLSFLLSLSHCALPLSCSLFLTQSPDHILPYVLCLHSPYISLPLYLSPLGLDSFPPVCLLFTDVVCWWSSFDFDCCDGGVPRPVRL